MDTPLLVPTPGMEPHITAFEAPFVPETDVGQRRTLYLHTSGFFGLLDKAPGTFNIVTP